MENIIDNMDDEDFVDKKLFTYTFSFKDMNDEQKQYVIDQFDDWDWSNGLHIAELSISQEEDNTKFIFKSPKSFEDKDQDDWTEDDLTHNLITKLIGKEQFIPTFMWSECGLDTLETSFFDDKGNEYKVEVNKYSSIMKKD